MKLPKKNDVEEEFSLFSPEGFLATTERTEFRNRAASVFSGLSRDNVAPEQHLSETRHVDDTGGEFVAPGINTRAMPGPSSRPRCTRVSNFHKSGESGNNSGVLQNNEQGSNKRSFRAHHEIYPDKYTKYSLEDTQVTDDMQNKAAAFDFLKSLRDRKTLSKNEAPSASSSSPPESTSSSAKLKFRKPAPPSPKPMNSDEVRYRSKHAVVQEEYVVGSTPSTSRKWKGKEKSGKKIEANSKRNPMTMPSCYFDAEDETPDG